MIRPSFAFLLTGTLCAAGWFTTVAAQSTSTANPPSATPAGSQDTSLGEAARKAKAQKKNVPVAQHVWTDDDIPKIPRETPAAKGEGGEQAATSAEGKAGAEAAATPTEGATTPIGATKAARGAAAAQGEKAASAEDETKEKAELETKWRQRFAEARKRLADDEKDLDLMQREYNLKRQQYYSDPNTALREQYQYPSGRGGDLNEMAQKIEDAKQKIEQDKQAISDLEDELRGAGLPSGWSRP